MAGRGPAPKDPARRARRNKDPQPLRVIEVEPVAQPDLPTSPDDGGWPAATVQWWTMWSDHPISTDFTSLDWEYLATTALCHAAVWSGDLKQMPELRLRVAKFGQTLEDRARLRITFAQADEADEKRGTRQASSRDRYEGLSLVDEA